MPFSIAETLCSGVPVVASDLPGQAALAPGLAARRLVGLDPAELAAAVRELLGRDPATAATDAATARAWVQAEMGLVPWAERLTALYERALAGVAPG